MFFFITNPGVLHLEAVIAHRAPSSPVLDVHRPQRFRAPDLHAAARHQTHYARVAAQTDRFVTVRTSGRSVMVLDFCSKIK